MCTGDRWLSFASISIATNRVSFSRLISRIQGRCAVALVITGLVACGRDSPAPDSSGTFVIRNVRIFDGERVISEREIVVTNGVIAAIGDAGQMPPNANAIDGAGNTLLPGLIDSHTHGPMPAQMKQAVLFGVTTQLDMFTNPGGVALARQFLRTAEGQSAADLRAAGLAVTAPGGHGTEYSSARFRRSVLTVTPRRSSMH